MRILALGDTHMMHKDLGRLPNADIIIHVGDYLEAGNEHQLHVFAKWWHSLPYKYKICIAGNHELCLEYKPELVKLLQGKNAYYLLDKSVTIEGINFYGSPWQPAFEDWAFNLPRNGEELENKWRAIPENTDVLLTHSPPFGYRDINKHSGHRIGCESLALELARTDKKQPTHHFFGHAHYDYGPARLNGIHLFNVANNDGLHEFRLERTSPTIIDM